MKCFIKILTVAFSLLCLIASDKTWATTIYQNTFDQRIPFQDSGFAWMTPVTLTVPVHSVISDLDVTVDITHTNVVDLMIILDSPHAQTLVLKDDEFMDRFWQDPPRPDMQKTCFDDQALTALINGEPPYNGRFLPARNNYLSIFNGLDAYGDWTLRIYDMAYGDIGTLNQVELRIDYASVPEPFIMGYLGIAVLYWCRRHRK